MAIAGYKVRVNGGSYTDEVFDVGLVLTDIFDSLDPSTEYGFEFLAYDADANEGDYGRVWRFTTETAGPADVAGMVRWYKPESLTGYADGDPIPTWTDASGAGVAATAAGAARPICKTAIANGFRVARFNGTSQYFGIGDLSALTAGEAFVVVKLDADPTASGTTAGLWHTGTDTGATQFPFTGDGVVYDQFGTNARHTTADPAANLAAAFRIYSVFSATNSWQNFVDGVQVVAEVTSNNAQFNAASVLGAGGSPVANFLDGDIAEFILYDSKLSGPDRAVVMDHLTAKYGL
jgi:hypothetical protein